jgi:hypothetical protein
MAVAAVAEVVEEGWAVAEVVEEGWAVAGVVEVVVEVVPME